VGFSSCFSEAGASEKISPHPSLTKRGDSFCAAPSHLTVTTPSENQKFHEITPAKSDPPESREAILDSNDAVPEIIWHAQDRLCHSRERGNPDFLFYFPGFRFSRESAHSNRNDVRVVSMNLWDSIVADAQLSYRLTVQTQLVPIHDASSGRAPPRGWAASLYSIDLAAPQNTRPPRAHG
jgi:hypothetical protein